MSYMKKFLSIIIIIALYAMLLAIPLQFLWNYCLVPAIDGVNTISATQALGLNFLAAILFKDSDLTKTLSNEQDE